MSRYHTAVAAICIVALTSTALWSTTREARFGGMVCTPLTVEQRAVVTAIYGEAAGVFVGGVEPGSLAAKTGVGPGDVLIAVRLPDETDYYPIPPRFDDFAEFCTEYSASDTMRLLLLHKTGDRYQIIKCWLGKPIGVSVPDGQLTAAKAESAATPTSTPAPFASVNPATVIANAPNGMGLTQGDVDLYGGLLAWAFGVRLTEAQKKTVGDSLVECWQSGLCADPQMINIVRQAPQVIPKMEATTREMTRQAFAGDFMRMAQSNPGHPFPSLVWQISASARNVLAGAGTDAELTQQDVAALLEYLCFQSQLQTGQLAQIGPEQRNAFTQQAVQYYIQASPEARQTLARMDEMWGMLRAYWAMAQAAQQQALVQQWHRAYTTQQSLGAPPTINAWQNANTRGGDMDDSTFNTMMNVLNNDHYATMNAISAMGDASTTSVYDGAGNWLYDQ